MADKTMKVTLFRSPIRQQPNHRKCVRGLGLSKLGQVVEVEDTPCTRGMLNKVNYMVKVVGE